VFVLEKVLVVEDEDYIREFILINLTRPVNKCQVVL